MNHLLFIGVGQIVIIALVVLLLFGGTKIPELSMSIKLQAVVDCIFSVKQRQAV